MSKLITNAPSPLNCSFPPFESPLVTVTLSRCQYECLNTKINIIVDRPKNESKIRLWDWRWESQNWIHQFVQISLLNLFPKIGHNSSSKIAHNQSCKKKQQKPPLKKLKKSFGTRNYLWNEFPTLSRWSKVMPCKNATNCNKYQPKWSLALDLEVGNLNNELKNGLVSIKTSVKWHPRTQTLAAIVVVN